MEAAPPIPTGTSAPSEMDIMELIIDKKRVTTMARGLEARLAERCGIKVQHADALEILAGCSASTPRTR